MEIELNSGAPLEYLLQNNKAIWSDALRATNDRLLSHQGFVVWPGGVHHHHNLHGGLVLHTAEVVQGCWSATRSAKRSGRLLDWDVLFTAALWHDYGKLFDYEQNPEWDANKHAGPPGSKPKLNAAGEIIYEWRDRPHRKLINHVARSYAEFMANARVQHVDQAIIDSIGHCILAHHGLKEWGSPVEPQSREAWALHLADQTSAKILAHNPKPHA